MGNEIQTPMALASAVGSDKVWGI